MSSYKLGQYFRERYDEFLGPIYLKDTIWFRADEIDRIVMTGELVAAGLYPPYKEQMWSETFNGLLSLYQPKTIDANETIKSCRWNAHLNWQPVPVWAPPMSTDYLYNGMFCKNFKKWRNEVETTDSGVLKFQQDHRAIYKYLSVHTGGNITQRDTFNLRQILYAQVRDIIHTFCQYINQLTAFDEYTCYRKAWNDTDSFYDEWFAFFRETCNYSSFYEKLLSCIRPAFDEHMLHFFILLRAKSEVF